MSLTIDPDGVYRPRVILRRKRDKRLEMLKAERRLELVPPRALPERAPADNGHRKR